MKEVVINVLVVTLFLCIMMLIKNEVTYHHRMRILKAIEEYKNMCFDYERMNDINCDDMENYVLTLLRIWDWGYTRILPNDKFEIIKPYIK